MTELRWILVGIGLAVLAGVYLWSRRRASSRDATEREARVEPRLEQNDEWPGEPLLEDLDEDFEEGFGSKQEPTGETGLLFEDLPVPGEDEESRPAIGAAPQRILVVHVRAIRETGFPGPDLVAALETEGLEYEDPGVYIQQSDQGQTLFTIANMFEPGSIPRDAPEEFSTNGLTAFMVLPGPGNAETLARMVALARRLAARLHGEVLDETGSTLTNQRATHMREEVIEFNRRSRISATEQ
jgi:cell division protein ZipA